MEGRCILSSSITCTIWPRQTTISAIVPTPIPNRIVLKEDLLEAFWGAQTNEARVSAEKNYGCGPFRDIEVSSGGQTILLSVDYLGPSVYWLKILFRTQVDAPEADSRIRAFLKEVESLEATSCSHEEATAGRTRR